MKNYNHIILENKESMTEREIKAYEIEIANEKDLINMLKIDCEILTFNTDYFEKRLEFLIKNGLKDAIKSIILNDIEAFEDEEDEIDLEELKSKYSK